jgi:phosphatidylglycerol---prolipoprotein diacylglyceryl transferase
LSFAFPNIDPVLLQIGSSPLKITWYSLSYVAGILLSWLYIRMLNKNKISNKIIDDLITYIIIGIIVGGRLGYVLFYDLEYNIAHPGNIIRTWDGGMSFHGGLFGVIAASFIFCKLNKLKFFDIMDLLACATPIGLFFGRISNFINAELYGRITDVSWGVIFPGQIHARHASQLYESLTEGLLSFIILYLLATKTKIRDISGMISGIFLLLYALFRTLIENYREPDEQIGFVIYNITMGQLLSTPMLLSGIIIIIYSMRAK